MPPDTMGLHRLVGWLGMSMNIRYLLEYVHVHIDLVLIGTILENILLSHPKHK
jgi:hypothetical protein